VEVQSPLDAREREALDSLQLLFDTAASDGESIWPGYRPDALPYLVFRPGQRSFLVNPRSVPAGAVRLHPRGIRYTVYAIAAADMAVRPGLPFSREFPVGDSTAFLVRHTVHNDRDGWFRLVVHEVFHEHQRQAFRKAPFPARCRFPYEDREMRFLGLVEEKLLASMMRKDESDVVVSDLALLAGIRSRRYALADGPADQGIEYWEEKTEGTARYVEESYAAAAGLTDRAACRSKLEKYLDDVPAEDLQKWKYYRSGLALALAMDSLGLDGWKAACEEDRCIFPFLLEALPQDAIPSGQALDAQVEQFRPFMATIDAATEGYLEREKSLLAAWQAEGTHQFRVALGSRGAAYYSNRGVTFVMADCSRLVTGILQFVDRSYGLEVRNRGIRLSGMDGPYVIVFYEDADKGSLRLDGRDYTAGSGKQSFARSLSASYPGFDVDWQGSGTAEVTGDRVALELY
jgi:hypothetical protein